MTTRLRPRILERHRHLVAGYREEELTALTPADGVALFRRQKIKGTRHQIEQVGERVGYHPLSLRLLAGAIMDDLRQPGNIRVAQQIKVRCDASTRCDAPTRCVAPEFVKCDAPSRRGIGQK